MGGVAVVLHIVGGHRGVRDPVVHHSVHRHCYRVPGEDLVQKEGIKPDARVIKYITTFS